MQRDFARKIFWLILLFLILGPIIGRKTLLFFIIALILYYLFKNLKYLNINKFKEKHMPETINIDTTKFKQMPKNIKKIITSAIIAVLLLWLFFASIVIVEAGETGVYSLFGKVKDEEYSSGFHLVIPLAKVTKMSIRTEEYTMSAAQGEGRVAGVDAITALTKEGLKVDLDMTVLFHLNEQDASDIYREVGLNYDEKIIRPAIRSTIRKIIAQYEAKVIYSEKRKEAAEKISESLKEKLEPRGIVLEDVLLRNVKLPPKLANSIEEKLQAEQEAKKMDFVLDREKKEKERKIIEAEGQEEAQRIINRSLTTNYLYYLYVNQLKDREGTIYVPTSPTTGMPLFRDLGR